MKIAAVVLHYRNWPGIRQTLDSLARQSHNIMATLVVDNCSGDGSLEKLTAAFPDLEIVTAAVNGGYAAGMNMGIAALAKHYPDAVLLLTHECRLAPDALEVMVARMSENRRLGAAGPLLEYVSRPGVLWSAGGIIEARTWRPNHLGTDEESAGWAKKAPYPVRWLDGACLLLRWEAVQEVGGFDEKYFLYYEETDFMMKLAQLGWEVECVPPAIAGQDTCGTPEYFSVRNRLGFMSAHAPRRFLIREILGVVRRLVIDCSNPAGSVQRKSLWPRLRGLRDFLLGRWGRPQS